MIFFYNKIEKKILENFKALVKDFDIAYLSKNETTYTTTYTYKKIKIVGRFYGMDEEYEIVKNGNYTYSNEFDFIPFWIHKKIFNFFQKKYNEEYYLKEKKARREQKKFEKKKQFDSNLNKLKTLFN